VRLAEQTSAQATPSEVIVSHIVRDLVAGSGIEFTDRGQHALDDGLHPAQLYAAVGDRPRNARPVDEDTAKQTPGPRQAMGPIGRATVKLAKYRPAFSPIASRIGPNRRRSRRPDP
jgi:hypothetical protein